jgi:glyoxylase-like metal-dependent hydrolase (beta-lactamase superfamily II)
MKIRAYGNNLVQLTHLGFINCYLVREEDGFTLIDTALESCAEPIIQAAKQFGAPIVRIVLTHGHDDHTGALDKLHELLPEAEVAITARDARFLAGDMSLDADEPKDKLRGGWHVHKTRPSRLLHDSDRMGSLEVIATPGHTPGHAAFLDLRDRSLIAGDAFQTMGGVAVAGTLKPLFPLLALGTWCKPLSLDSARKLRALEPSRLAVGHGRVLDGPLTEMDRAIEVMARALEPQKGKEYVSQSGAR